MDIVADYRRRAAEVEKLAAAAAADEQRQRILEIARTWAQLADQREQMIKTGWLPKTRGTGDE